MQAPYPIHYLVLHNLLLPEPALHTKHASPVLSQHANSNPLRPASFSKADSMIPPPTHPTPPQPRRHAHHRLAHRSAALYRALVTNMGRSLGPSPGTAQWSRHGPAARRTHYSTHPNRRLRLLDDLQSIQVGRPGGRARAGAREQLQPAVTRKQTRRRRRKPPPWLPWGLSRAAPPAKATPRRAAAA
jgi:hypothetical protein